MLLNLQERKPYENKDFFAWFSAPSPTPSNSVQTVEFSKYLLTESCIYTFLKKYLGVCC